MSPLELRRHVNHAVAGANQPADHQAQRLEHAPHFLVAPLRQDNLVPVIRALSAAIGKREYLRRSILQFNALEQLFLMFRRQCSHDPHRVFALDFVTRMHEPVGKLAKGREYQQTLAVEIQTPDRDPFGAPQSRQLVEHRRPSLGVGAADDLSCRLVIQKHPHARRGEAQPHQLAVDAHLIVWPHFLTDLRRLTVDGDAPGDDQFFEPSQRSIAALRQHLVQALRLGKDGLSGASGLILAGAAVRRTR